MQPLVVFVISFRPHLAKTPLAKNNILDKLTSSKSKLKGDAVSSHPSNHDMMTVLLKLNQTTGLQTASTLPTCPRTNHCPRHRPTPRPIPQAAPQHRHAGFDFEPPMHVQKATELINLRHSSSRPAEHEGRLSGVHVRIRTNPSLLLLRKTIGV